MEDVKTSRYQGESTGLGGASPSSTWHFCLSHSSSQSSTVTPRKRRAYRSGALLVFAFCLFAVNNKPDNSPNQSGLKRGSDMEPKVRPSSPTWKARFSLVTAEMAIFLSMEETVRRPGTADSCTSQKNRLGTRQYQPNDSPLVMMGVSVSNEPSKLSQMLILDDFSF